MEIKVCSKCKHPKPLEEFHRNGNGKRRSACGDCYNEIDRARYLAGQPPEVIAEIEKKRALRAEFSAVPQEDKNRSYSEWQRLRRRERLALFKRNPCTDCGWVLPKEVMDYDHREPDIKVDNVGSLMFRASDRRLEAEIEKCDLVCANCHRVRESRRRAGLPATLPPPEYHI